jgi:hypothetical protein
LVKATKTLLIFYVNDVKWTCKKVY